MVFINEHKQTMIRSVLFLLLILSVASVQAQQPEIGHILDAPTIQGFKSRGEIISRMILAVPIERTDTTSGVTCFPVEDSSITYLGNSYQICCVPFPKGEVDNVDGQLVIMWYSSESESAYPAHYVRIAWMYLNQPDRSCSLTGSVLVSRIDGPNHTPTMVDNRSKAIDTALHALATVEYLFGIKKSVN